MINPTHRSKAYCGLSVTTTYCALNNRSAAHDTFDRSLVGRGAHPAFIRGEQRSYSGPCCPRVYTVAPSRHAAHASDERGIVGRGSLCSTVGMPYVHSVVQTVRLLVSVGHERGL